jgi:8-oxo-dGTP diphosphatase
MSQDNRHSVSVAAVVTNDDGRVLVVQRRDNGEWQIPGGVLELDESIHAGLQREVEEETGLIVEPERLTGIYKNLRLGVVALVFEHMSPVALAAQPTRAWPSIGGPPTT